jgi:hypothetical protein
MGLSCHDYCSLLPGVAGRRWPLAPNLAPREPVSVANVRELEHIAGPRITVTGAQPPVKARPPGGGTELAVGLIRQAAARPADAIGPAMARLRRARHHMPGNGYGTRAPELDCAVEAICETRTFVRTSTGFRPARQAQHDHAAAHHQDQPGQLFASRLARIAKDAS